MPIRALAAILTFAASSAQPAQEQVIEAAREKGRLQRAAMRDHADATAAKYTELKKEIDGLADHPWAGTYIEPGAGLGGRVLMLAPDAGFLYYQWSDVDAGPPIGVALDANYGSVGRELPEAFELEWKIDPGLNERDWFEPTMYRIEWCERRYLATERGLIEFCNAMNCGSGGRDLDSQTNRVAYLRSGDRDKAVEGKPQLPEQYRDYLLDRPIETHIIQIIEARARPAPHENEQRVRTRIDAGRTRGVRIGMLLYPTNPRLFSAGRVVECSDTDAIVDFRITSPKDAPSLKDPVSTRSPDPAWALSRPSMP